MLKLSRYVKRYHYPEDPDLVLLFSTKTAAAVLVEESVLRALKEGTLTPEEAETLSDVGLVVQDLDEEKHDLITTFDRLGSQQEKFKPVVILNMDCNLACRYCFEGALKGRHYMSRETAGRVVDLAARKIRDGMSLEVDFYGGEPLLSYELMVEMSERMRSLASEAGADCTFGLITNGTLLTRKRVEVLASLGLTVAQVTLDGPADVHDAFRPYRSGSGSFETIVKNLKDVCGLIKLDIGGNYTQENFREFPRLLDDLAERGITPDKVSTVRFSPVMRPAGPHAPPEFSGGCVSIREPWLYEAIVFLREETLRRGFWTLPVRPTQCMLQSAQDIVISHDGTLYKCPAFVGWDGYAVGSLAEGVKNYRESLRMDAWKTEECLECPYLPLCFGGCRYEALLRDPSEDGLDCKRGFYDAVLERLVRQDLRYIHKIAS